MYLASNDQNAKFKWRFSAEINRWYMNFGNRGGAAKSRVSLNFSGVNYYVL